MVKRQKVNRLRDEQILELSAKYYDNLTIINVLRGLIETADNMYGEGREIDVTKERAS